MKVLMLMQRGWALRYGEFIARRIRADYPEARFAAAVSKWDGQTAVGRSGVDFEHVWHVSKVYDMVDEEKDPIDFASIADACGLNTIWPLVVADRQLYYNYERKYYYALERHASDRFIKQVISKRFQIIEEIFDVFAPDIIIGPNFVSPFHVLLHGYAAQRGVPMVGTVQSKLPGILVASSDPQITLPRIVSRFDDIVDGASSTKFEAARRYIARFRDKDMDHSEYRAVPLDVSYPWPRVIYDLARRFGVATKNLQRRRKDPLWTERIIGLDNAPLHLMLRDVMGRKRYVAQMKRFAFDDIDPTESSVLYALQFQPEEMQDVLAPHFADQVALIRQLALAMPDDHVLYVKEHPGCVGYRGRAFYGSIKAIPNVKLIHPLIPSTRVIRHADAVIATNGTIAFEAALLQKPAVVMGSIGGFTNLPHVTVHSDVTTLHDLLHRIMSAQLDDSRSERSLIAYVAALMEMGRKIDVRNVLATNADEYKEAYYALFKPYLHNVAQQDEPQAAAAPPSRVMPDPDALACR